MVKHKLMLPVLAVIVGIAASAFTVTSHGKRDTSYFQYSGNSENGYTDINNWHMFSSQPSGCSDGSNTCVVSSDSLISVPALVNYLQVHNPQVDGGSAYDIIDQNLKFTEE